MIIQSVLFFILGVVVTVFLLTLCAPILWRRALYLARKIVETNVPISLREVEADRDFLRAKHAIALVREREMRLAVEKQNGEQKVRLSLAKEQAYHLGELELKNAELQDLLQEAREELATEKELNAHIENIQGTSIEELRSQIMQNHLDRADIANNEAQINALHEENEKLRQQLQNAISSNGENPDKDMLDALREDIKTLAANIVAQTMQAEGKTSPIIALTQSATGSSSLAARIKKSAAALDKSA